MTFTVHYSKMYTEKDIPNVIYCTCDIQGNPGHLICELIWFSSGLQGLIPCKLCRDTFSIAL